MEKLYWQVDNLFAAILEYIIDDDGTNAAGYIKTFKTFQIYLCRFETIKK